MAKYRKKPVVIEAMCFDDTVDAIFLWVDEHPDAPAMIEMADGSIAIETLEGTMTAQRGDWIICGVKGEFYPCKPDIFAATYEPV